MFILNGYMSEDFAEQGHFFISSGTNTSVGGFCCQVAADLGQSHRVLKAIEVSEVISHSLCSNPGQDSLVVSHSSTKLTLLSI